jgi:hypothetical protein
MGKEEAGFVLRQIKFGLLKGDSYGTLKSCGCFLGSAAKNAGLTVEAYCKKTGIKQNGDSPAELWFLAINIGDVPENNYASKKAAEWIEEVLA